MLLSNRRAFLAGLTSLGAVSACGYTPVYGPGGSAEGLRGSVTVAAPSDPNSYELVKRLEQRLGRNLSAPYMLDYTISTETDGVGVTPRQEITRNQVTGTVIYSVTSSDTGEVVQEGSVTNFTSYSTEGTTVSTDAVERDAERRLMVSLADLMMTRFLATFSGWGG